MAATLLAVIARLGSLPDGLRWLDLAIGATLAEIGVTVAIFIATLAFAATAQADVALIGILVGSLLAVMIGLGLAVTAGGRAADV